VANQAAYTLRGNNSDCGSIVSVKYGTGKKLLEKWDENRYDEMLSSLSSTNEDGSTETSVIEATPKLWFPLGEENKFPRIQIYGTPGTAGEPIYYRYYKNDLKFDLWPDQWAMVLILGIESDLFSSGAPFNSETEYHSSDPSWFSRTAENILGKMIAQYERGGGEDSPVPLGRKMRERNRRRNHLYGY